MPKKLKGGTLWDFSTSILSQNIKKLKWDPLRKIFRKSLTVPKKSKGRRFVSSSFVRYAKNEQLSYFNSIGQMVQFGVLKFRRTCRTILVSSCGLKKSHYNCRVSLHEAPTKNDPFLEKRKRRIQRLFLKI